MELADDPYCSGIGLAIVQKLLADGVFVSTIQRSQSSELIALEKQYPDSLLNVQASVYATRFL